MKIIFDNNEQQFKFLNLLGLAAMCPGDIDLKEVPYCNGHKTDFRKCRKCWEISGIETEVNK